MRTLATPLEQLWSYSDRANGMVLEAAAPLTDAQLDQPFDMGLGSLRRTLLHVLGGEAVWLCRWRGERDKRWPDVDERVGVAVIRERFADTWRDRHAFLSGLTLADYPRRIVYRDSYGSLYSATLQEMILQGLVHSMHHRAQAVNMIRRVGGHSPEVDFMYSVRGAPAAE